MKKKVLSVIAACALLALSATLLAGCGGDSKDKAPAENPGSADAYTLIVGFDAGYPPYGFMADDGSYTGFDLDLAKAVAEKNGWGFEAKPIDWDAKDAELNTGSITCIWNGFTFEGREDKYTWSDPYMLNEQVIVVKADSGIAAEADLAGKNVMTQVDSAALDVLSDEEGKKALADTFGSLQTIGDYNNAFMQLDSGMVDAVACDLSIAQFQMAANPDKYVIMTTLSSEHYAVGFKIGDTETAAKVTSALKELYNDGTVKELCDKYAEYGLSYENWILK